MCGVFSDLLIISLFMTKYSTYFNICFCLLASERARRAETARIAREHNRRVAMNRSTARTGGSTVNALRSATLAQMEAASETEQLQLAMAMSVQDEKERLARVAAARVEAERFDAEQMEQFEELSMLEAMTTPSPSSAQDDEEEEDDVEAIALGSGHVLRDDEARGWGQDDVLDALDDGDHGGYDDGELDEGGGTTWGQEPQQTQQKQQYRQQRRLAATVQQQYGYSSQGSYQQQQVHSHQQQYGVPASYGYQQQHQQQQQHPAYSNLVPSQAYSHGSGQRAPSYSPYSVQVPAPTNNPEGVGYAMPGSYSRGSSNSMGWDAASPGTAVAGGYVPGAEPGWGEDAPAVEDDVELLTPGGGQEW